MCDNMMKIIWLSTLWYNSSDFTFNLLNSVHVKLYHVNVITNKNFMVNYAKQCLFKIVTGWMETSLLFSKKCVILLCL